MSEPAEVRTLLGRADECGSIDALVDGARAGEGGALLLRGPAGIGKSALLAHAELAAPDATMLRATGAESEADLAFASLHALLRPVAGLAEQLPAAHAAALSAALSGIGPGGIDRFLDRGGGARAARDGR